MTRAARCILIALLLLHAPVWAAPPTNQEAFIQPDETFPWVCDFGITIASVTGTVTYLQGGTSGTPCPGLLTNLQVNASNTKQAIWQWTPAALNPATQHVCWLHLIATDAFASKYACDGKITVKRNRPTT